MQLKYLGIRPSNSLRNVALFQNLRRLQQHHSCSTNAPFAGLLLLRSDRLELQREFEQIKTPRGGAVGILTTLTFVQSSSLEHSPQSPATQSGHTSPAGARGLGAVGRVNPT